jgi:hypothetical protein
MHRTSSSQTRPTQPQLVSFVWYTFSSIFILFNIVNKNGSYVAMAAGWSWINFFLDYYSKVMCGGSMFTQLTVCLFYLFRGTKHFLIT